MTEPEEGKVDSKDDDAAASHVSPVPKISIDSTEYVPRSKRLSDTSASIVAESMELLGMKSSIPATLRPMPAYGGHIPLMKSRSSSPDSGAFSMSSVPVYPKTVPTFKRIDFDDRLAEAAEERKPAWKNLQESVTDSYRKAKRTVERTKDEQEFLENTLSRTPRRRRDDSSPFRHLTSDTGFVPSIRSTSSYTMPSLSDRSRLATSSSMSNVFASGSGPYAAPAVSASQGIEARYEDIARDVEARLLKSLPLSAKTRAITMKEYRRAPEPASGSVSERDDYDFSQYAPRPYYSRPNRDDPDYFDFDLQHSVDLFKRPEGKYVPRRPQEWESRLVEEATGKGSAPLSGYMFTRGDSDWRSNGSSYLSAALRTPKFWEQRFESLGKQVRDSNPISLESINRRIKQIEWDRRNRPITSRFTEYRDPDHDDYIDPHEDD